MEKGFTLIELLAVIVILAIIALIATPLVITVIDGAKKGAFKDSAYGIVKAGELGYTQDVLDGTNEEVTFTYTDGIESSSVAGKTLNYKGSKPQNGKVKINKRGKVALAIHNGTYCAEKLYNDSEISLSTKSEAECIIPADTSGASVPELATGMIPVKWDGSNWIKANVNNEEGTIEWYNYDEKIWANAVTVTSTNRSTYESAAVGTTISISDINTMWVWIPRYKYAIPTGTEASEINIKFETKDTTKSTGTAVDNDYFTHPAFTFGSIEVDGIWVGKFETTGDSTTPTVKPDSVAVTNYQSVKEMYDAARAMESDSTYGFNGDEDVHMIKNSEWGAVIYLSYSKYGINDRIYKNNSSNYYTGRSGGNIGGSQIRVDGSEKLDTGFYTYDGKCATTTIIAPGIDSNCTSIGNELDDKSLAFNASTTGNIYGVYDLAGGSWERTMAIYRPSDSTSISDSSGFEALTSDGNLPDSKYWDRYTTTNRSTACNGNVCYGHALSETYGRYSYGDNVDQGYPWQIRGGNINNTTNANAFEFFWNSGSGTGYSLRLIVIK